MDGNLSFPNETFWNDSNATGQLRPDSDSVYGTLQSALVTMGTMLGAASILLNAIFLVIMQINSDMSSSPYHRFMQNLAVADLMASFTFLLIQNYPHGQMTQMVTIGEFVRHQGLFYVLRSTPWLFFCAYILTLTCLTGNQYIAIWMPTAYSNIMSKKRINICICVCWAISSLQVAIPAMCLITTAMTSDTVRQAKMTLYRVSTIELQVWMSLFVISTLLNIIVDVSLYLRIKALKARSTGSNTTHHEEAFVTVSLLLFASMICRLPFQMLGLVDLSITSIEPEEALLLRHGVVFLLYLNFFGDPIVYIVRIRQVRQTLGQVTRACRAKVFKSAEFGLVNQREEASVTRETEMRLNEPEDGECNA